MITRRPGGWAEPLGLLAVAAVVAFDARSYPPSLVAGAPGPAFFPRLLAAGVAACGLALLAREIRGGRGVGSGEPEGAGGPGRDGPDNGGAGGPSAAWKRVSMGAAVVAACLALAIRVDFFLALPLLVLGLMLTMGERRRLVLAAVPVLFALAVYAVFLKGFGAPLPTHLG